MQTTRKIIRENSAGNYLWIFLEPICTLFLHKFFPKPYPVAGKNTFILALLLLLTIATAVNANNNNLIVSPSEADPGQTITVTGTGFQPGAWGLVWGGGPYIKSSLDTLGNAYGVSVSNGYAYVADGSTGLQVIDIINPNAPVLVGSVDTPGDAYGVSVSNGYAYVADGVSGLQVVNISNPTIPIIVGSVDTAGSAGNVSVVGGYAYVADGSGGLQVIDISDPAAPVIVGNVVTAGDANDVDVANGYAYVASFSGLQVVDISNPINPIIIGSVIAQLGSASLGVDVKNGYAYIVAGYYGLHVIDINTPASPIVVGHVANTDFAKDVSVSNGYAYVTDNQSGLLMIDISNPVTPLVISSTDTPGKALGVSIENGYAYLVDDSKGLQVIDIQFQNRSVIEGSSSVTGSGFAVVKVGDYAYVASNGFGMQVFDVTNPQSPILISRLRTQGPPVDVDVDIVTGYAYLAEGSYGFQIVDISNPAAPVIVGSVDTPGGANGVSVANGYAYVAGGADGFQVIDISNPLTPVIIGNVGTTYLMLDVRVLNGYAYVTDHWGGLKVINISNPAMPVIVGSVNQSGSFRHVEIMNGYAYVVNSNDDLLVIDISNPVSPVVVGSAAIPGLYADSVTLTNSYAYVTSSMKGLHVFDISTPATPVFVDSVDIPGRTLGLDYDNGYIYVGGNGKGLDVVAEAIFSLVTWQNPGSLTLDIPTHLSPGTYDVTISNPDGTLYKARNALTISGNSSAIPAFSLPLGDGTTLPTVTQDYSCHGNSCFSSSRYHSGIDFEAVLGTDVYAAAPGTVVKVCNDGQGSTDPASACFTSSSQPDQLGNVVVIKHNENLYSLYAHLSSIDVSQGTVINQGQRLLIGKSGDTGNITGPHLHFEIKDSDDLISLAAGNIYPPDHPNVYGYVDPWSYFTATVLPPVTIEVVHPAGLNVRRGPSTTSYSVFTEMSVGQRFVAFARYAMGGDIWYRVHLPCDNANSCAGWVAGTVAGKTYSETRPAVPQLVVKGAGPGGLKVRAAVPDGSVLDKVYEDQRFVMLDSAPSDNVCAQNWYQIYTPLSSFSAAGWVCGEFVQLFSSIPAGPISLSGRVNVTPGLNLANIAIDLTGTASGNTSPDGAGAYAFTPVADGAYTITPSATGYEFEPTSHAVTVSGVAVGGLDFRACENGNAYSGTLTDANSNPIQNAEVTIDGNTVTTNASGYYSVTGLACGSHPLSITPINGTSFAAFNGKVDTFNAWSLNLQLANEKSSYGLDGQSGKAGDPVDTATGNYIYQHRDVSIPGIGMAFSFDRSYNSRDDGNGSLGFNWTHNWNISLDDSNGMVEVRWEDGATQTWSPDGVGGFTPQSGVFDVLIDDGGGAYTVRKKNLMEYHFDTSGRLGAIEDRNGNIVSLTYTANNLTQITDTAGRNFNFSYDASNRITEITDPINRTLLFAYDLSGDLVTATDANSNVTTYTYDTNHQILSIIDPRGNTIVSNTYDALDRVVNYQTDAKGGATNYVYDLLEQKTTFTDAEGYTTVHYHDSMLRLIREQDGNGGIMQYDYDVAGNRSQVTDKNGNKTQYAYDLRGNVTQKTDALANVTTISYDANDNPLSRTDALGNTTTFVYDANGNLTSTTDALSNTSAISYYPKGLPHVFTNARGFTTTHSYDAEGNLVQIQDHLGNTTLNTYDGVGRRLSMQDARLKTRTFTYDHNDNLLTATDPANKVITHIYDENNNRVSTQDKNNNISQFEYDEKDLFTTTTDALAQTTVNGYDALDRRTSLQDKNGNITLYEYDAVGNLLKLTDALDKVTQQTYDPNRNLLSTTNPLGQTTQYAYDKQNRRITLTDALGNISTANYDALGRVVSSIDAKGQSTGFIYDKLGRLKEAHDANSGTVLYDYDENGNRILMTGPNNHTISYSYDELDRLIQKTEPEGNVTQYQYDEVGNLKQLTKPDGVVIQYSYNNLNRLQEVTYPDNSTVAFAYDANGNRIQMVDSLGQQDYVYDVLNRMTSHTDPFSNIVGYGYDFNGNRVSLTYPDSKVVNYAYDKLNRLTDVTDWLTNNTHYNYDNAGHLSDTSLPNGTTADYGYDIANRLTSLSNKKADNSVINSYSYTLDAIGNQTAESRDEPLLAVLTPGLVTYTYDAENRLTVANGNTNDFDNNGNLISKGFNVYAYDYENRPIETTMATTSGITTQYQYDGLGNRYTRTRGDATTHFILDTNTRLTNVLAETDASYTITAYNVYGLGLIARIQPGGAASYYHYDSRGSTIALSDNSGVITDTYAYDLFGSLTNRTGTTINPFTYIGRHGVLDEGDDLFYIRARYYDSDQQRFVSKDAKLGSDQDGQSLNRYVYGLGNPVRYVDVSGFSASEIINNTSTKNKSSDSSPFNNFLVERINPQMMTAHVLQASRNASSSTKIVSTGIPAKHEGVSSEKSRTKGKWRALMLDVAIGICDYVTVIGICSPVSNTLVLADTVEEWVPVLDDVVNTPKNEPPKTGGGAWVRRRACGGLTGDAYLDCVLGE